MCAFYCFNWESIYQGNVLNNLIGNNALPLISINTIWQQQQQHDFKSTNDWKIIKQIKSSRIFFCFVHLIILPPPSKKSPQQKSEQEHDLDVFHVYTNISKQKYIELRCLSMWCWGIYCSWQRKTILLLKKFHATNQDEWEQGGWRCFFRLFSLLSSHFHLHPESSMDEKPENIFRATWWWMNWSFFLILGRALKRNLLPSQKLIFYDIISANEAPLIQTAATTKYFSRWIFNSLSLMFAHSPFFFLVLMV